MVECSMPKQKVQHKTLTTELFLLPYYADLSLENQGLNKFL